MIGVCAGVAYVIGFVCAGRYAARKSPDEPAGHRLMIAVCAGLLWPFIVGLGIAAGLLAIIFGIDPRSKDSTP